MSFDRRDLLLSELPANAPAARAITVMHGDDLLGRNIVGIANGSLCSGTCLWCSALTDRIRSRLVQGAC